MNRMQPSSGPLKKSWFRIWFDSPFYHKLYNNHDDTEAHDFIEALLHHLAPIEQATIMDLACGRGRFSKFLAEKGYWVTGLDLSKNSIQEARKLEGPNLSFFQHDMRLPFRINYYDYIFNFFTSFGYFERESEDIKVLKNVRSGLRPAGGFVLDFFNANYVASQLLGEEIKEKDGIQFHIHKYVDRGCVFKDIRFETAGQSFAFKERVRLYRLEDFQRLFTKAGLKMEAIFGDYNLKPFNTESSPRLILLARKEL